MTTLRAAEKFEKSHLSSPEVAPLVDGAKAYYVGGFFLTHGTESALELAQKAASASKVSRDMPTVALKKRLTSVSDSALRSQPLRALHSSIFQSPTRAGPSIR